MIRFRYKNFGLPALGAIVNGLMAGGMLVQGGMQMKQASDQAKEAEEQNERMLAAQKRENAKKAKVIVINTTNAVFCFFIFITNIILT